MVVRRLLGADAKGKLGVPRWASEMWNPTHSGQVLHVNMCFSREGVRGESWDPEERSLRLWCVVPERMRADEGGM